MPNGNPKPKSQTLGLLIALAIVSAVGFLVLYFKADLDTNLLANDMGILSQQLAQSSKVTTPVTASNPAVSQPASVPPSELMQDPIAFSADGIDVRVSKRWWIGGFGLPTPLEEEMDIKSLKDMAAECGHAPKSDDYYASLTGKLDTQEAIQYDVTYNGPSQDPTYVIYAVRNAVGYKTLDDAKADLDVCAAGGVYPFAVSPKWIVFVGSCGGAANANEPAPQCGNIQKAVDATLKLVE